MELLGTELDPDWYVYGGDYQGGVSQDTRTNENARLDSRPAMTNSSERRSMAWNPRNDFITVFKRAALCFEAASLMPGQFE